MRLTPKIAVTLVCLSAVCTGGSTARAADCEDIIARHMVGEALLAAHLVALAEKAGLKPAEINATLKSIAGKSAAQEFWITDSRGPRVPDQYRGRLHVQPGCGQAAAGVRVLAADHRRQGHRHPGGAQARNRRPRVQICRRRRRRQAPDRAGRSRRGQPSGLQIRVRELRRQPLSGVPRVSGRTMSATRQST